MTNPIASLVRHCLPLSVRVEAVVGWYLLSLMLEASKHSQSFAARVSGLHRSQFSRLLADKKGLARDNLSLLSRRVAKKLAKKRKKLLKGAPWTIGIIVDSTLHPRSSLHVQNAQRLNHGEGFVIGHQWTNIVLVVGSIVIPLPPIAFLTKRECRRRGTRYRSESERVIEYLRELQLSDWIGPHDPSEVLTLVDSGYDVKKLQKAVLALGWDFISALKPNRGSQTECARHRGVREWCAVERLFRNARKPAPWETVRDDVSANRGKKRKEFRARRLQGYLKGLKHPLTLVCSEKKKGRRKMLFLACSNTVVSTGVIVRAYRKRWLVELFHRDVKGGLGMCHAGVEKFDSLVNHVHWVYCSYLFLIEMAPEQACFRRQKWLQRLYEKTGLSRVVQMTTRADGLAAIKSQYQQAIQELEAA